jgi:uncharacterized DUF497 family protein
MLDLRFEWDKAKSDANLRRRGFDFEFASRVFEGPTVVAEDSRRDYGERRFVVVGVLGGRHVTVVYTDRMSDCGRLVRRVISARRSSRRERETFSRASVASVITGAGELGKVPEHDRGGD